MKEKVLELLNDEIYEICDAFEPSSVADLIVTIVNKLDNASVITCEFGKYLFKVNNKISGFVSCSDTDEGCTGVSMTQFFPYYTDDDGLKNLIEMVNEAFYLCEN